MAPENEVLNLSTTPTEKPPCVVIDRKSYPFLTQRNMKMRDQAALQRIGKRFENLQKKENISDAEADEMDAKMNEAMRVIMPSIEKEVAVKLGVFQKVQILQAFNEATVPPTAATKKETAAA